MNYTPGPWEIIGKDTDPWTVAAKGRLDSGDTIAEVTYTGGNAGANARLIAAAPVLLAACEKHIAEIDTWDNQGHAEGCDCGTCAIRYAIERARA